MFSPGQATKTQALKEAVLALDETLKDELMGVLLDFSRSRAVAESFLKLRVDVMTPTVVDTKQQPQQHQQPLETEKAAKFPGRRRSWNRRRSSLPSLNVFAEKSTVVPAVITPAKKVTSIDRSATLSLAEKMMQRELQHSHARRESKIAKQTPKKQPQQPLFRPALGNFQEHRDTMKLIFLDVDGVLHSMDGYKTFTEKCMQLLFEICDASGARIVLSSTWRQSQKTMNMVDDKLREYGMEPCYSRTPLEQESFRRRSEEIIEYLETHASAGKPLVSHWIAIDDMDLGVDARMEQHFVLTDAETGLVDADVDLALRLLGVIHD